MNIYWRQQLTVITKINDQNLNPNTQLPPFLNHVRVQLHVKFKHARPSIHPQQCLFV